MIKYLLLLCAFSLPNILLAQDNISPDRPGEGTNAATVVAPGRFQLESGFYYQHDVNQEGKETTTLLIPNALLRVGLFRNMEVRFGKNYISDGEQAGADGWVIGTKIGILQETADAPALALQTQLTLPKTGSKEYRNAYTQPTIVLLASKKVAPFLGITTNLGVEWQDDDPRARYTYGLSFDFSITDALTAFIELYGTMPEKNADEHLLDYGLSYRFAPNFQLDMSSGSALSDAATDYFVSMGLAWRFKVWGK